MSEPDPSCADHAGITVPVIDRSRCEAKADCVRVCPFHVFDVRALVPDEKTGMGFLARVKLAMHGGKQAFVARAEACHACGLCVEACPEGAITLVAAAGDLGRPA